MPHDDEKLFCIDFVRIVSPTFMSVVRKAGFGQELSLSVQSHGLMVSCGAS